MRSALTVRRWLAEHAVQIVAGLVLVYLFLPVLYTFVFSFNSYTKSNISWSGNPTLEHWRNPCGAPGVFFPDLLAVGITSTVLAVVLGTSMALVLARGRFRGGVWWTCWCCCRWPRPRWCWEPRC